jgi:hypothetical protein
MRHPEWESKNCFLRSTPPIQKVRYRAEVYKGPRLPKLLPG